MKRFTPLPAHEQMPPAEPNLVKMFNDGFWSCHHCKRITTPVDYSDPIEPGEEYKACQHCGSKALKWNPPIFTDDNQRRCA